MCGTENIANTYESIVISIQVNILIFRWMMFGVLTYTIFVLGYVRTVRYGRYHKASCAECMLMVLYTFYSFYMHCVYVFIVKTPLYARYVDQYSTNRMETVNSGCSNNIQFSFHGFTIFPLFFSAFGLFCFFSIVREKCKML